MSDVINKIMVVFMYGFMIMCILLAIICINKGIYDRVLYNAIAACFCFIFGSLFRLELV